MRDMDIRHALHQDLKAQHSGDPSTLIVDELGLCQGVSRVDVAVINGSLTGFEIKSERDTLVRLPAQQEVYSRTLDFVTLIVNRQHLEAVDKLVPDWWGLQEATETDGVVVINTLRAGRENPGVDPYSVAQLLWRDETLDALKEKGLDKGLLSKPRQALWMALASNVEPDELKTIVRTRLKARANWRSVE